MVYRMCPPTRTFVCTYALPAQVTQTPSSQYALLIEGGKMSANPVEKAFCVIEFSKSNSATVVKRRFRTRFAKAPPTRQYIYDWHRQFETTGCLCKRSAPGRPRIAEEQVERVRATYLRSPQTSTRRAIRELQIPKPTVWKILRKRLKMIPYKIQMLQRLSEGDKNKRCDFCESVLGRCDDEEGFMDRIIFSDESTFHISGKVNKQNVRIWGTEKPTIPLEHVRDSPKVNVFCAISSKKVYGSYFFKDKSVQGASYLNYIDTVLI